MEITRFGTDVETSVIQHTVWDMLIVEAAQGEDLAKLTKVPASFIRNTLAACDHEDEVMSLIVTHEAVPDFTARFEIIGLHGGTLWGVVNSNASKPKEVRRRFEQFQIIDEQAVLSMADTDNFDNVAILRDSDGEVELLVASVAGLFEEDLADVIDELIEWQPRRPS